MSPAAPYRHFRDRDELLANVAFRGFTQFEAALSRGMAVEGHGAGARLAVVEALAASGVGSDHEGISALYRLRVMRPTWPSPIRMT